MLIPAHELASSTPDQRSPLLSRRELIRAALFASAASALGPAFSFAQAIKSDVTAAARGEDGSKLLADPNWKPVFLSEQQNNTLIAISDVVIPADDTPGAKAALVNRYIDLLLSVQPAEFQQHFVGALAFIDSESQKQFGNNFVPLTREDQTSLLTTWAYPRQRNHWITDDEEVPDPGQQHFGRVKALIAASFYGSEIGMKELGWDGTFMHGPYQGCEHTAAKHT